MSLCVSPPTPRAVHTSRQQQRVSPGNGGTQTQVPAARGSNTVRRGRAVPSIEPQGNLCPFLHSLEEAGTIMGHFVSVATPRSEALGEA